ncbi:hypothetical protein [Streptococcus sp. S784/96/1]|nr:hypothetical protein [Streptococcus sp. S784/96/1]
MDSFVLGESTYYSKFGHVPDQMFGIEAPSDVPGEYFMVCFLNGIR